MSTELFNAASALGGKEWPTKMWGPFSLKAYNERATQFGAHFALPNGRTISILQGGGACASLAKNTVQICVFKFGAGGELVRDVAFMDKRIKTKVIRDVLTHVSAARALTLLRDIAALPPDKDFAQEDLETEVAIGRFIFMSAEEISEVLNKSAQTSLMSGPSPER